MSGFEINSVALSGNLTRDPDMRSTRGGTDVTTLRIAHNSRRKDGDNWVDDTHFFDVTVWSGMGRWCNSNLSKGDKICVHGRLQWREWETKEGHKRQAVDIVADSIVPQRSSSGGNGGGFGQRGGGDPSATDESQFSAPSSGGGGDFAKGRGDADDDIPF